MNSAWSSYSELDFYALGLLGIVLLPFYPPPFLEFFFGLSGVLQLASFKFCKNWSSGTFWRFWLFLFLTLTPVSFYCSDSPFGPLSKCNRLIQTYKIFESGFQVPLFSQLDNLFGTPSTNSDEKTINFRKSSPIGQKYVTLTEH